MSTAEKIMREIQTLPDPLAKEVFDFIEYLEMMRRSWDCHARS